MKRMRLDGAAMLKGPLIVVCIFLRAVCARVHIAGKVSEDASFCQRICVYTCCKHGWTKGSTGACYIQNKKRGHSRPQYAMVVRNTQK